MSKARQWIAATGFAFSVISFGACVAGDNVDGPDPDFSVIRAVGVRGAVDSASALRYHYIPVVSLPRTVSGVPVRGGGALEPVDGAPTCVSPNSPLTACSDLTIDVGALQFSTEANRQRGIREAIAAQTGEAAYTLEGRFEKREDGWVFVATAMDIPVAAPLVVAAE